MKNITYASSEWSGEAAHLCSFAEPSLIALKRGDVNEGSGQIVYTSYVI